MISFILALLLTLTCAVTIRIVVGFAVMAFAFKFDFPPFMVLIIALLNDGTIMTLSVGEHLSVSCVPRPAR